MGGEDLPVTGLIELDASTPWEPPARRHGPRWLAVGLLVVGSLALLGGAQRPDPLDPLVTIPGTGLRDLRTAADHLYVLRQFDPNRADLEAYRLRNGARLWATRLDSPVQLVAASDDRVVVYGSAPGATDPTMLIGLDAATGAEAWRRPGYAPAVDRIDGASGTIVADPSTRQLVGLDIRTGAERWTLVTPAGTVRSFLFAGTGVGADFTLDAMTAGGRLAIGELAPDGTLTVRSAIDGAVVRTAKIEMPARVDSFDVSGDRLIIPSGGVYDLRTGRRLWGLPNSPERGPVWWCGAAVCSGIESSVSLLDPDTGQVRWQSHKWISLSTFGPHLLVTSANAPTGALLVDAVTGRTVRNVAVGWGLVGLQAWPNLIVSRGTSSGHAVIARLDVETGSVTVFGRAERWHAPSTCFTTAGLLVCRDGQLSIWRLPN